LGVDAIPHAQLYFDVQNEKGETEKWQGEVTASQV
jgi:hypothetical protein